MKIFDLKYSTSKTKVKLRCAFNEKGHTIKRLDTGHTRRHFDTPSIDLHNDYIIIGYGSMFNIMYVYIYTCYL